MVKSAIGHGDAIAVIGDGAISAGMAYEALNKRLIVILNVTPKHPSGYRVLGSTRDFRAER
jgi:hypothetical protein